MSAGDYQVEAHVASGSYIKEMTYDGIALSGGVLRIPPGSAGTLRVVASQGGGSITCKVVDSDGKPVPDSPLVLVPAGVTTAAQFAQLAQQARTNIGGTFTSPTLPPGKYHVLPLTRSYRLIPEDIDKILLTLFQSQEVEVTPKSTAPITLHIE
jgi:hypothetical protein